eukprot:6490664-Amphidinium_carterae.1
MAVPGKTYEETLRVVEVKQEQDLALVQRVLCEVLTDMPVFLIDGTDKGSDDPVVKWMLEQPTVYFKNDS